MTPFPWRSATLGVLAACAVALVVWDVLAATNRIKGDTISEISLSFVQQHPLAAFALWLWMGIIFGHLFWPQYVVKGTP